MSVHPPLQHRVFTHRQITTIIADALPGCGFVPDLSATMVIADVLGVATSDLTSFTCSGAGAISIQCVITPSVVNFTCCAIDVTIGGTRRDCSYTAVGLCELTYSETDCAGNRVIIATPNACGMTGEPVEITLSSGFSAGETSEYASKHLEMKCIDGKKLVLTLAVCVWGGRGAAVATEDSSEDE